MASKKSFQLDWLQIVAVLLVVALASFMVGLAGNDSQAIRISEIQPTMTVRADLADMQPTQLLQLEQQWLARFNISTEAAGPIKITGIVLAPQGTLAQQMVRQMNNYPLTLTRQGITLGKGDTWIFDGAAITQTVALAVPFSLDVIHPLEVDVATDLNGQQEETFGVSLFGILTVPATSSQGLPVEGKLFEIQERF